MSSRGLQAVVAMASNRVIGNGGKLPWHLPADFRWFKRRTMGGTLIMGRTTFESIGKPLPGRHSVVLTRNRQWQFPGVEVIHDPLEIQATNWPGEVFVIGGAQVYAELLPRCSDFLLTRVTGEYTGDTVLPPFEQEFAEPTRLRKLPDFEIWHYRRLLREPC